MQYRRLGRTNFMAAEVGLGAAGLATLAPADAAEVIRAAVAAGSNVLEVDARVEVELAAVAAVLRGLRTQLIVVGVGNGDRATTEATLATLALDHFDCYLAADAATLGDVQALAMAGLTRTVGVTATDPALALAAVLDGSVDVLQLPFGPLELRHPTGADALLIAARDADVGVLACSPLAGGRLTADPRLLDALAFVTNGAARSVAQAAIAWSLSDPRVAVVVAGPRTIEQARENAEASRVAPLSPNLLERIAAALGEG